MAFNLKSFFGAKPADTKSVSLTDPEAFGLFGVAPTATGITVSANTALRVPAVSCAVGLIAETVGTMPVKVYDRTTKEALADHPAFRLIHGEANPWTSAQDLCEQVTTDALMTGSGFALLTRDTAGTPLELHRIDPAAVQVERQPDGEPVYLVSYENGGQVRHLYTDILHVQPFGGVSPITLGREAIALSLAFEKHIASLFANGARPSGIIKSEKSMDVEAKKKVAASWFNTHSGQNAGGTAILDEGMTYDQLSMTLADAQFADNRVEQIREIARVFRIPPTMLFELTRGTWSNSEQMMRQFYSLCLKPWLASWEWAYSRVLLTPEERAETYIEFNTDDLLSTDHATRATAYGQYRSMGAMTGNEVRRGLNMPDHEDGNTLDNPHITTPANQSDAQTEGDAE
ncbi:phage portal protein [Thalassorhabdomicrobium marinisediminis]|uniref:Phage portal protein n=1 Tax=Thalassorhabdomicrobium marinisediminis TaxID=2170577 RepID=A0A2T7FVB8_9RHOB|nr:phage portal protein [Thalassorhabdomicrobium marinisediminis]PVA06120.1 phage portal protein [Thalassorhabdomicrobium marinisediminis]